MIYQSHKESVLFVHIPRNAGRYVDQILYQNGIKLKSGQYDNSGSLYWKGKMLLHLTAHESEEFYKDFGGFDKNFCVVRNPVDHFLSAINAFDDNITSRSSATFANASHEIFEELMERTTYTEMFNHSSKYMYRGMINLPDRFFKPQHEFLKEDTMVWRYEDGMGRNFREWLRDHVGLPIEVSREIDVNYSRNEYIDSKKEISEEKRNILIECVRKYYAEDFSTFNYS